MFTIEIKINNVPISRIDGVNVGEERMSGNSLYEITHYDYQGKDVKRCGVKHDRANGILVLCEKVFKELGESKLAKEGK